jgi:hypothetical protein
MGLFSFFSKPNVTEFAKTLVSTLSKRYPPSIDAATEKKISEARLTKVLEDVLGQATEFQQKHHLGLFGKAKLGNEFRWQLKELGYTDRFIEVATEGLMVYITRGSPQSAADAGKK